ncbi:sperm-associated antigen 8 [Grus japonensis]|uniref:Sperm-associated antigen 8 n=1 Tax=Grus japonensis TaxID=30415 RepID=A0ABC9XYW4_GRUJA
MNHPDPVPGQEPGSEGFIHRRGHPGLLDHQLLSWPNSTTTKDTYRPPHRVLLLGRGQREAMLESMLYQKYRQAHTPVCHPSPKLCPGGGDPAAIACPGHGGYSRAEGCRVCSAGRKEMQEEICVPRMPMESVSTTHQDYCAGGYQSTLLLTSQGVTSIRSGDCPFRRNAAFSTPITEYLEQPLPCPPLSSRLCPHKQ